MKEATVRTVYMDDYNYHDWARYMVQKPAQKPKGPHFAGVLLDERREWDPPYDQGDVASSHSAPDTTYFAFPDKEVLTIWVDRATRAGKCFFFFEVKQLGTAQLQVEVGL